MSRRALPLAVLLAFAFVLSAPAGPTHAMEVFVRADVNFDGVVNIADAISVLEALFGGTAPPLQCEDAADANDDGLLNIADAVSILAYLFTAGTPDPPQPFPNPGFDGTPTDPWDCGDEPVIQPGGLTRIAAGDDSGAPEGEYVIRTNQAWSGFWAQHGPPGAPPPVVDFTNDIVLAFVRSFFNGTHCVEILDAEATGIVTARIYHWTLPCAPLIIPTTPYDIVIWENGQLVPDPLVWDITEQDVCPLPCP